MLPAEWTERTFRGEGRQTMPERPDLRQVGQNIGEALAGYDRDALLSILTYVFKEYVVQGPPPLLVHQAESISDLEGLSFAELITALQTRLSTEELALFTVEGDQVSVLVDGGRKALSPQRVPAVRDPALTVPPASPSERTAQTAPDTGPARVAQNSTEGASQQAPPPRRGLSVQPRPQGAEALAGSSEKDSGSEQEPRPVPPKEPLTGDDASVRFSLLEFD